MPDKDSKNDKAEALLRSGGADGSRKETAARDPAAAPLAADDETADPAITPEQAGDARDREIHAVGPGPGVIPPEMTEPSGPDNTAPDKRETVFPTGLPPARPTADSGRPVRWVLGVFVAALALWLLVRMFG